MKMPSVLSLLSWSALASVAYSTCYESTETFEKVATGLLDGLVPITKNIGELNGLEYRDFSLLDSSVSLVNGVAFSSGHKAAAASLYINLIYDTAVTLYPFGTISAGRGTASFDLESFRFGCLLDTHTTLATAAQTCNINVCGTTAAGEVLACEAFRFEVTNGGGGIINQPMAVARLPKTYRNLKKVYFGVAQTELGDVTTTQAGLLLDDVQHCNYPTV